jgi:hypothetical protein
MRRAIPLALLTFVPSLATANIEWPVLYAFRAVEFTTAQVQQCNQRYPAQAPDRSKALEVWRGKNASDASAARAFNLARTRSEDKDFDLLRLEQELIELEVSALRQIDRETCMEINRWLLSEESDVLRQLPAFMRPR